MKKTIKTGTPLMTAKQKREQILGQQLRTLLEAAASHGMLDPTVEQLRTSFLDSLKREIAQQALDASRWSHQQCVLRVGRWRMPGGIFSPDQLDPVEEILALLREVEPPHTLEEADARKKTEEKEVATAFYFTQAIREAVANWNPTTGWPREAPVLGRHPEYGTFHPLNPAAEVHLQPIPEEDVQLVLNVEETEEGE